jgi:dTDP-4-amino-4,6-dideoxygalactose transaminase
MNIPLVNLARQYTTIEQDIQKAILAVCKTGDFILGQQVEAFEAQFAKYIGVKYCIGVASGTDAIKLMALASGIKPGDEIITQANTFIATVLPFIELGAIPVFVDCDEHGAINVDHVKKAITKKTRAIIPVHLFGVPAPMKELSLLSRKHNLLLLEDAAQAHGSTLAGRKCGSFGHMSAFSFYPGKNLGALGDGGAIVTNSPKYAAAIRMIRNIGQKKKYDHTILGTNSRLDTIQAAALSVKLKHLDAWNKKRDSIAHTLIRGLTGVGDLILPYPYHHEEDMPFLQSASRAQLANHTNSTATSQTTTIRASEKTRAAHKKHGMSPSKTNWHLFVIQTKRRDALASYLNNAGIHTGIHYPVPLHMTPALKFLQYKKGDFPVSEARARTMLTLPLYAELTEKEVQYIVKTIKQFYAK